MQILVLLCKGNWAKLVSAKVEVIDKYVEVSVPLKQTVCFSESGHSIGTNVYLPVACLTGWLVPIVPAPVGHSYTRTVNSKIKNNTAFRSLRYRVLWEILFKKTNSSCKSWEDNENACKSKSQPHQLFLQWHHIFCKRFSKMLLITVHVKQILRKKCQYL